MFVVAILLAILLSGLETNESSCGLLNEFNQFAYSSKSRILAGNPAYKGKWPWLVSVRNLKGKHVCGGSLLNHQWILSAAHCFKNITTIPLNRKFILGEHDKTKDEGTEQSLSVVKIIFHEKFVSTIFNYDIALIKLEKPVEFTDYIRPVCLPDKDDKAVDGENCMAVGWGRLSYKGLQPDVLQEVEIPIYNREACDHYYNSKFYANITEAMICAGLEKGGKAACQGDSGGPLLCPRADNQWHIIGLLSFSAGCGLPNLPSVFTKVSFYRDWIDQNIKEEIYPVRSRKKRKRHH